MPLKDFFAEQLDELREFLDSQETTLRAITHAPDTQKLLLKLLVTLEDDPDSPHILVVVDGAYKNSQTFFVEALRELVQQNEQYRSLLQGDGILLPKPDTESELSPRHRFKRYVADVAGCLPEFIGSYAIIFTVPEIEDEKGFREDMCYLAANTRGAWGKYVVLDRLKNPILEKINEVTPRASIQQFHLPPDEIERRVKADLASGQLSKEEQRRYTAMAGAFAAAHRRYDEAEQHQHEVLKQSQGGAPADEATALYDLGNTYLTKKQFDLAESHFVRSANICLEHEINGLLAMVLTNLGVALHRQKRMDESILSFDTARRTFHALQNLPGEAHALDCKARVLQLEGRNEEAVLTWREALAVYDSIQNPAMKDVRECGRRDVLEKLTACLRDAGDDQKVRELEQAAGSAS